MLYKASTTPALDARRPRKTAAKVIQSVAIRLGKGSAVRALHEFAKTEPVEFWKLYGKTIERGGDVNVQINTGPQEWTIGDKKVEF